MGREGGAGILGRGERDRQPWKGQGSEPQSSETTEHKKGWEGSSHRVSQTVPTNTSKFVWFFSVGINTIET